MNMVTDVNLGQVSQLGNALLGQLNDLRESDPIHWSEASQCWIVTRHADLVDALDGKFPLSLKRIENITFFGVPMEDRARLYPNITRYLPNWAIEVDPPIHTRLRKLLVAALNRKVVEAQRPFVQQRVAELMDKLEARPEVEFSEQVGRLLPGGTILKLLGLPQSYLGYLQKWGNSFQEALGVPGVSPEALQRAENTFIEMNDLFRQEIDKRRNDPQLDLITSLIEATEDGDKLTVDEMLGAIQLVIIAGHDTTHNTLSLGLAALAEHPEFWDYMYRNPDKTLDCVMELMRYIAMSTSQARRVSEDFEWHGKQLKKDQIVFLMLAGGNRDPRAFTNPEKLDHNRPANEGLSLVFAPGVHHCVGHMLAKMQVAEFFGELVKRFEGATLLDDKLNFMPQVVFRGLYRLNVKMQPRRQQ